MQVKFLHYHSKTKDTILKEWAIIFWRTKNLKGEGWIAPSPTEGFEEEQKQDEMVGWHH